MTVALRADVYPATLVIDPGPNQRVQDRVRVLVLQGDPERNPPVPDRLTVFADASDGPHVVYSQLLTDFTAPSRPQRLRDVHLPEYKLYQATTQSGTPIQFEKSGGCGCGSRLRGFNPFPALQSLAAT
jgi:hypothetical protein